MEALIERREGHLDRLVEDVVHVGVHVLLAVLFGDRRGRSVRHELHCDCLIETLTRDLERQIKSALKVVTIIFEHSLKTP